MGFLRRYAFQVLLLIGLAVRLPFMLMPGTEDMYWFRMWGAQALRHGLVKVYTLKDTDILTFALLTQKRIPVHPHVWNDTELGPVAGVPDYPPGNIFFLELAVAMCKVVQGGSLRAGPLLNACINFPPVLFSLAMALTVWWFLRKEAPSWALPAAASLWLNPALILTSPILGYQDPIFAFFVLLSLILFYRKKYTWSTLLLTLACLIKPQAVFAMPVLAVALWSEGGWPLLWRQGVRFVFFSLAGLVPYILTSRTLAVFVGVFRGAAFGVLSAQNLNIWWLVGCALLVLLHPSARMLSWEFPMFAQAEFLRAAGFDASWVALPAFAAFTGLNLWHLHRQLRIGNRLSVFWAAALEVYAYTMLALSVHEHHLYAFFVYAAPLLAPGNNLLRRLFWGLSAIYGLNLFLFDGFGEGLKFHAHWLRTLSGFDLTILVSLANVAVFILLLRAKNWWFDLAQGKYSPTAS